MTRQIFRMPEHHYDDGSVAVTPIRFFESKGRPIVTIANEDGDSTVLLHPGPHLDSVIKALTYLNDMHRTDGKTQ